MTERAYDKPLPQIDGLTEPYWQHAREHRLAVQHCLDCGHQHFPPGPVCPQCLSSEQDWQVVSGKARLLSWCRFHRAYWPGFQHDIPYDVCVVKLEEGPLLVANLQGVDPAVLRMGMEVEHYFDDVTDQVSLLRFRPKAAHSTT